MPKYINSVTKEEVKLEPLFQGRPGGYTWAFRIAGGKDIYYYCGFCNAFTTFDDKAVCNECGKECSDEPVFESIKADILEFSKHKNEVTL